MLELNEAGRVEGAGGESAGPSDPFETERLVGELTYGIECRHPRISVAILEVYARRHSIDFTPGTSLDSVPPGAMDHLRPTLIDFLKTEVGAGSIRLYREKVPTRKRERILKFDFAPQPTTREDLTFIGVEVKDQDDVPVAGTRVRFELPDGDIKIATTNSEGIARIDGLALPGNAKVSLLDFNEPGDADPVEQDEVVEPPPAPPPEPEEQPEPKEFAVKIVDETGKGVAGIPMVFSGAGTSKTVPTDASGVAKWKAATESVEVTFESAEAVNKAMKAVWQSRAATPLDAYLAEGSDVVAVTSRASAVEALGGDLFNSLSVAAAQPKTLSIRPAKKRAVLIEMHDTLFRTGSAVVNPEGEAPATAVGEHESITTVGLVATILRYNEEHEGKKLFVAGHADRAGDDAGNVKLSEHRAKAVLALVEGKKADYIADCGAKHSEVDVTQLFDWVNRQFNFTCKPTVMDRPPSDENYVKFRKSFNLWVKNGPAEGEKEPRGTEIGQYGRLQPDLWGAMFDLYEYNLRDELGEDSDGVATLRQGLTWVDGDKKAVGFGEKHPTTENAVDGMRSQADRRVEVLLFDGGEEPDLAATNGEEVYDGVTFEKTRLEAMKTARRTPVVVALRDTAGKPVVGAALELSLADAMYATGITNGLGECQLKAEEVPELVLRITQIDESGFSTAEVVEQPYYFAEEFAEGVLLPFARHMVVTLSLCHFSLTLDDTTLLSEPQIATLVSADGLVQRQTQLPARARGDVASVIEFSGLPTFNKKYRLSVTTGKLADIVFEGQTLLELAGTIEHARSSLAEPEPDSSQGQASATRDSRGSDEATA